MTSLGVLVVVALVAGLVAVIALARAVRRRRRASGGRLGARRYVLEAQAELLDEGPKLALLRLRLQLDEALGSIDASQALGGGVGDVDLLSRRIREAGGRVAVQLDALLRHKSTSGRAVGALRPQVREVERLADRLHDAALGVAGGAAGVELHELGASLEDEVAVLEARTDALRELSRRR